MDPQKLESPHHEKLFIGIIVGLLLGGAGGYYAGWIMAQTKAVENAMATTPAPTVQANAQAQTNPLEDVKTNPLEDVKTNPFE